MSTFVQIFLICITMNLLENSGKKLYTRSEIIDILKDDTQNEQLFKLADETRKKYCGDEVHLRGLIEFSNICRCFCKYCGLRSENKGLSRYRIEPDDIISCAKKAVDLGYKTIVLQSGEDAYFTADIMCKIITGIKKLDAALTLSIGERSYEEYRAFKDAGADRFLLRIETTDKKLYKAMHPHMDFENRKKCLCNLKKIGYETGTGCLVGLEGQTIESLADDILFFKELDADMVGIGPFIPHPQTPLRASKPGNFTLALKVMALTRILLKNVNIPATTAMETLNPNGRIIALQSGANVIMPNVTNPEYSLKYEIYPEKIGANGDLKQNRSQIERKITAIGRTVSKNYGFRSN